MKKINVSYADGEINVEYTRKEMHNILKVLDRRNRIANNGKLWCPICRKSPVKQIKYKTVDKILGYHCPVCRYTLMTDKFIQKYVQRGSIYVGLVGAVKRDFKAGLKIREMSIKYNIPYFAAYKLVNDFRTKKD